MGTMIVRASPHLTSTENALGVPNSRERARADADSKSVALRGMLNEEVESPRYPISTGCGSGEPLCAIPLPISVIDRETASRVTRPGAA